MRQRQFLFELLRAKSERRLKLKWVSISQSVSQSTTVERKMRKKLELLLLLLLYVKKLELMCVWNSSCFTWSILFWRRQEWNYIRFTADGLCVFIWKLAPLKHYFIFKWSGFVMEFSSDRMKLGSGVLFCWMGLSIMRESYC